MAQQHLQHASASKYAATQASDQAAASRTAATRQPAAIQGRRRDPESAPGQGQGMPRSPTQQLAPLHARCATGAGAGAGAGVGAQGREEMPEPECSPSRRSPSPTRAKFPSRRSPGAVKAHRHAASALSGRPITGEASCLKCCVATGHHAGRVAEPNALPPRVSVRLPCAHGRKAQRVSCRRL